MLLSCRRRRCRGRRRAGAGRHRRVRSGAGRCRRSARRATRRNRATSCPGWVSALLSQPRGRRGSVVDLVARLRVAGGLTRAAMCPLVDSTNRVVAAEQLGAAVAVLPGRDVVGDAGDDVGVGVDAGQVDRHAQHLDRPGVDKQVVHAPGRRSRRAGRPPSGWCRRSRTGCRTPAASCRAGSCSPSSSRSGRQGAARRRPRPTRGRPGSRGAWTAPSRLGEAAVGHSRRDAGARSVDHSHSEAERGQPILPTGRGQIAGRHGGEDAAGADTGQRGALDAGDPLHHVHRVQDGSDVGIEVPGRMPRVRVAPGHARRPAGPRARRNSTRLRSGAMSSA